MEDGSVPPTTVTKTFVGTDGGKLVGSLVRVEAWTRQEVFHRINWPLKKVKLQKKQKREMPWRSET